MLRQSTNTCCSSVASLSGYVNCTQHCQCASSKSVCVFCAQMKHPLGHLLFTPDPLPIHFTLLPWFFFSPSQPGAPSDHPLLCWLDFSLVNSQRLNVTSPRSLPTDYSLSLFFYLFLFVCSSENGWYEIKVMWMLDMKTNLVWQVEGSKYWWAFKAELQALIKNDLLGCNSTLFTSFRVSGIYFSPTPTLPIAWCSCFTSFGRIQLLLN